MYNNRKYYIDVIKIFSIFMVIFIHTGEVGFYSYQTSQNMIQQIFYVGISIICNTALPLFFMCSGALLLAKDETIAQLMKRRVLKYVIITIVFTMLYYIFLSLRANSPMNFVWIFKTMYESSSFSYSNAYWFLYSYIGLLLILPILRLIARGIDGKIALYLIVINTCVDGILPLIEILLDLDKFAIDMTFITTDMIFYPLIGFYVGQNTCEEMLNTRNKVLLLVMALFSMISSSFVTLFFVYQGVPSKEYLGLFRVNLVLFIFIGAKVIIPHVLSSEKYKAIISKMSSCTLGIYLIHGYIYTIIDDFIDKADITMTYGIAWARAISVFGLGLSIVWLSKSMFTWLCMKLDVKNWLKRKLIH